MTTRKKSAQQPVAKRKKKRAPSAQPPKPKRTKKTSAQSPVAKKKRAPSAQQPMANTNKVEAQYAKAKTIQEDTTMTLRETAKYIGCHPSHVRWLLNRQRLQGVKIEVVPKVEQWFIFIASADKFLAEEQATGFPRGRKRKPDKPLPKRPGTKTRVRKGPKKKTKVKYKGEKPAGM